MARHGRNTDKQRSSNSKKNAPSHPHQKNTMKKRVRKEEEKASEPCKDSSSLSKTPLQDEKSEKQKFEIFEFTKDEQIYKKGMFKICVLKGAIQINNAIIKAQKERVEHYCYNATRYPIYAIKHAPKEFYTEDFVPPDTVGQEVPSIARKYKKLSFGPDPISTIFYIKFEQKNFDKFYITHPLEKCGKVVESVWKSGLKVIENDINEMFEAKENFVPVYIKGESNSGKSMFCKALINKVLTQMSSNINVILLDIDLSQPIFGIPGCIRAIKFNAPLLSNYELNIDNSLKSGGVAEVVKSYFINEINSERNAEYYKGTDFQISRSSDRDQPFHGMIGTLYKSLMEKAKEDGRTVVIINASDDRSEMKNMIVYRMEPLDFEKGILPKENKSIESLDVLQHYKSSKGSRRNKLLKMNMFNCTPELDYYKENMRYPKKIINFKHKDRILDVLYSNMKDYNMLLKLQPCHYYYRSNCYISIDMSEEVHSDMKNTKHMKDLFQERVVALCKVKSSDLEMIKKEHPELQRDNPSYANPVIDFDIFREFNIPLEQIQFGFLDSLEVDEIKIKHRGDEVTPQDESVEVVICVCDYLNAHNLVKNKEKRGYTFGDTASIDKANEYEGTFTDFLYYESIKRM
ncbi:unnamed protein product [Moneuplotes crassus]|uniref:Clp1 P-loop domain-containing protein n=1 Tax=Euplotes crassus TaxID=5936 RepID=A0AAD1X7A7_EUPCR|nr:unnamed protein product [Moneuplotes crassus]